MTWIDWLLLAGVLCYCLYVLFRKKKKHCCGDCARCGADCVRSRNH